MATTMETMLQKKIDRRYDLETAENVRRHGDPRKHRSEKEKQKMLMKVFFLMFEDITN
jgi:hypothetical protein